METKKLLMALLAIFLISCAPVATATSTGVPGTTSTSTQLPPVFDLSKYAFPESIDTTKHYLFYLHGRILEDQGIPAVDPNYGKYEYQAILEKLGSYGFVVISEQRAKNTDGVAYAKRITTQVTTLLNAGVPAANITIVGASKGGWITVYASYLLANPKINFVIMAICDPATMEELKKNEVSLYGNVLSMYDVADTVAGSCQDLFSFSEGKGLSKHNEIVLQVGTGHGVLFKPLDEWIMPVVQWSGNQ